MTEYELGEMMHAQSAQMWQAGQMYFTLVSAYLVVGYLAGSKLTSAQARVITVLYLVWIATIVAGQISAGVTYGRIEAVLFEMGSHAVAGSNFETPLTIYSFLAVQLAGIIASLWFMWSIRHPKEE